MTGAGAFKLVFDLAAAWAALQAGAVAAAQPALPEAAPTLAAAPAAVQEALPTRAAAPASILDAAAPADTVARLAALGPRLPATPAHAEALDLLVESLRRLGVDEVRVAEMSNGTRNVEGLLRGAEPAAGEIVLAAHYDTVAGSPGAADDAAGCAVILGAVADLRRTPLRRTLRILFFDGEEAGLLGSTAWASSLSAADRDRILGTLHLDVVGLRRSGAPVLLDLGGAVAPSGPARAPAWLVHAALRAGAAVGFRFRVGDHRHPLLAQLLTRTARVPWSSDAAAVLEAGIPALLLTDFSALDPYDAMHTPEDGPDRLSAERLERWVTATAAVVRRLDALAGRPRWEEEYLALAGRVWIRRDLLWIGLVLWIVLVLRGSPGRWAGAHSDERRSRGRSYLPGYLFRLGFLIAAIWMPALAAPLLYPLAPLALLTPRTTVGRLAVAVAACLPTAIWLGLLAVAAALGLASGLALEPGRTAVLGLSLATFAWQVWSRTPRAPSAPSSGPTPPPSAAPVRET
jgi:Peptidase family M28